MKLFALYTIISCMTNTFIDLYHILTQSDGWHAVAQLVEALRYKPEALGFDSRWFHWNFSLT
jgi:hypothetical protein